MKITINTPCSEKLSTDNYCTKCEHQIPDLSSLSKSEAINHVTKENITCAIFRKDQLINSNPLKNIYNIVALSTATLLIPQVNAQELKFNDEENLNQTIRIETKEITFKIISNTAKEDETFRLLINDKLILEDIKANQDYNIKFDIEKNSTIEIRVASNQYAEDYTVNYSYDKLPEKVIYNRNQMKIKPIIMGKIAIKRN